MLSSELLNKFGASVMAGLVIFGTGITQANNQTYPIHNASASLRGVT
jgi:hypothetical protein